MSDGAVIAAARSVIDQPLPPAPPTKENECSLVLFYQYKEPPWTEKEHRAALKKVIAIANANGVTGRGRCAKEGLNCSLTGKPDSLRAFCYGLRDWKPELFNATDFKITDHIDAGQGFKALTIRRTDELVAYGMADEMAPSLSTSTARHADADEYHELMRDKDAVVIDVRNAYESAIGHFQPPAGGATLIDPKMRNSHEFPKWLNAPETKEMLHGKKVLMYCTGGIRCERASALLDTMSKVSEGAFQPGDVVMVRGGIERYMKTFPEGGFWKGKNYLFDRRREQVPEAKSEQALSADIESYCCVCNAPESTYRGKFACGGSLPAPIGKCGVPVLVCANATDVRGALCAALGRNADAMGKGAVAAVRWLSDRTSGLFYGSCYVEMLDLSDAQTLVALAQAEAARARDDDAATAVKNVRATATSFGSAVGKKKQKEAKKAAEAAAACLLRLHGRRLRVAFAPPREGDEWPPGAGEDERERPPVGVPK